MVDRLVKEACFEGIGNSFVGILHFMKTYLGFVISSWFDVSATCSVIVMFAEDYPTV
jgi:hypothetical protein